MNVQIILFVLSALCFIVDVVATVPPRIKLVPLGLFFLALAFCVGGSVQLRGT